VVSERTLVNATPAASADAGWSVEIRRANDGLAGIGAEWDDLFARCAAATPFQAYAWLESWWRSYGVPGRLRLVLVRHGGRLVAAAPLMLRWRAGCPVLTPLGGALSDFTDVLVDDEVAVTAAGILADALVREPGWQAVDFPEVRPRAVTGAALWDAWSGGRWATPASLCLDIAAMPMDDLVRSLPKRTRARARYRLNQLERAGVDVREVAPAEVERAVADLVRLHALQWQGRAVNHDHLSAAFADHLSRAMRQMIASGQAAILEYRLGDRLMASSMLLISRDVVGAYLYGVDPALREHVDVTVMMLADAMPLAHRLGCSTMSMLRGAEEHKLRWQPEESLNRRIVLTRPRTVRGTAYATGVRAYRAAVLTAKEHAPWLRTVRDGVRRAVAAARRGGRR
jgi:CelD/BcsL family acetyltransferase involved in cellulose biosynthesis